jgi:hypothetical protein
MRAFNKGFTKIHITTGYNGDEVEVPHFVISIISKDFPL